MADPHENATSTAELRPELRQTIEHIKGRWAKADTAVLKHTFPLVAKGRPVSITRLADAAGTTLDVAERAVDSGRVELDGNGDIVEVFGVTLKKTLHRLRFDDACLYSCCALVAHVVPRLVNRTAEVCSEDPVTGDEVQLEVAPDSLQGFQPGSALASMIITDERSIHEDAPVYFCQHVHHFTSRKTADEFVARVAGRYTVTLAELDTAARIVHSAIWS